MNFKDRYIYLILFLALTLNWIVSGSSNVFGKESLNLGLLPKQAVILVELFQLILLVYIILVYKNIKLVLNIIIISGLICGFYLFVHSSLNHSVTVWISGIRYYFSFIPLFLLAYILGLQNYNIKKHFSFLIFILFIQIPISFYQFIIAPIKYNKFGASLYDVVSGTMGGFATNLLSCVLSFGIIYFLVLYFEKRKLKYLIFATLLVVPSILASAKGMYVLLIIIIIYLLILQRTNIRNMLNIGIISIIFIIGFSFIYQNIFETRALNATLDFEFLVEYAQSESGRGRLSRTESITNAFRVISSEGSPIFGLGIGSANSNPLGKNLIYSDSFSIRHSLDILITETGFLGLIILFVILYYLFQKFRFCFRNKSLLSVFELQLVKVFGGVLIVFIVSLIWTDTLYRVQFMYPFALLCGYVIGMSKNIRIRMYA